MELNPTIRARIEADAQNRARAQNRDTVTNAFLHREVLASGQQLNAAALRVSLARDTVLVFVDLAPTCNWAHPCEYHLYDANTGDLYQTVEASLPPAQLATNPQATTTLRAPVQPIDREKLRARRRARPPVAMNAMSSAPGERYAILYSGISQNRHYNDLEFLYRTLIDDYGFAAANIRVCNHEGKQKYFLNGPHGPITTTHTITVTDQLPGTTTAYRMPVHHAGTRTGFKAALNDIAAMIRPEDFLFIHTNNHGGGPCDPGITDYCVFEYDAAINWNPYYVNDFVTDLNTLPACEVLMVMMEQCRSGGFIDEILGHSPATWTHVAAAVVANDYSQGGTNFDAFAEDWIAGIHGQYANGDPLSQTVDTNGDGRLSAAECFAYADAVHHTDGSVFRVCPAPGENTCQSCGGTGNHNLCNGDSPRAGDAPAGYGQYMFLGLPKHDLYLRDNLLDHGREPLINGGISCSPDIIVYNQQLLDPDATLGTPAAQGSDTLGTTVESGQDNFIYLRVQNRGSQATDGTARLFYSLPSALPAPISWHEITDPNNPVPIPAVNPGEMNIVEVVWHGDDIPPYNKNQDNHYCFVGLINSGSDPAPNPATIHTIDDYYNFIRASNNATWKNFDVVDMFANSVNSINFVIQGWPRMQVPADLLIDVSELPADMAVRLRTLRRLSEPAVLENAVLAEETEEYQRFALTPGTQARLNHIRLRPSDCTQATLEITVPAGAADGFYRVAAAEVIDGKQMGRITRMLAVGQHPFMGNLNTLEVHKFTCDWTDKISAHHKVAYQDLDRALRRGFNGCRFCLPAYSTD